jgi:3'(2'), 5'-bisphosphate nucleotidase
MLDVAVILDDVCSLSREAGGIIMRHYGGFVKSELKADLSPVTVADIASNKHIFEALLKLTPNIPIISEEKVPDHIIKSARQFWLVDPLDGTKDFLEHNNEFTVNIAFIQDGIPIMGVVYAPALELLYYATVGKGAWKQLANRKPFQLGNPRRARLKPIAVVSRHHLDDDTKNWLEGAGITQINPVGSSLKLCFLADGTADVYPRLSPIMQWDIAAADAILRVAGGSILQTQDHQQPHYLLNQSKQSPFIATNSYFTLYNRY